MTEPRTIDAVVSALFQTGLTVEQQLLVSELSALAVGSQTRLDAELERKAGIAERVRRHRALQYVTVTNTSEIPPIPPRDINKIKNKITPKPPLDADFEDWYSEYPRKEARRSALKAYFNAVKRGATPEELLAGAKRYAQEVIGREKQFIKQPASWLNADCHLDEPSKVVDFRASAPRRSWAEIKAERESR